MVSAMAEGTTASHIDHSITGQVSTGGPAGTAPSTSTPASSAGVSITSAVETTSTTSAQGTTGSSLRPPRSTRTDAAAMRTDQTLAVGSPVNSCATLSRTSAPESIFTPSILAI